MDRENNQQLTTINDEEEIYVTNAAIKTTDVLCTVGAGLFAAAGIGVLINTYRKGKRLKEKEDYKARIIERLVAEGASKEEIQEALKILAKID